MVDDTSDAVNLDTALLELLHNVLRKEGFSDNYKIKIQAGSEAGDGFLGVNKSIDVSEGEKYLKLFVKTAPKSETFRKRFIIKEVFNREIYFYEKIYPEFVKFQTVRQVSEGFTSVARSYGTSAQDKNETLILENLKGNGFTLFNRATEMNSEHIAFVFRQYARFHSISFAMKDQDVDLYEKLTRNLNDLLSDTAQATGLDKAFEHYAEESKKLFVPGEEDYLLTSIRNLPEILVNLIRNVGQCADEYSAITQGDCWCNNMMFKYENSSRQSCPSEMKLIDWQMFRVNSPVLDLSYFFYGVASKEIMANLDYYLDIYYTTLSESIKAMGTDSDKVYPRDVFREHWRKHSRFGLMQSFLIIRIMLTEKGETLDMGESTESGKGFGESFIYEIRNEDLYNKRIRDVIEHFVFNKFI